MSLLYALGQHDALAAEQDIMCCYWRQGLVQSLSCPTAPATSTGTGRESKVSRTPAGTGGMCPIGRFPDAAPQHNADPDSYPSVPLVELELFQIPSF